MDPSLVGLFGLVVVLAFAALLHTARQLRAWVFLPGQADDPWIPTWAASEGGGSADPPPGLTSAKLMELRPSIRRWVMMHGVAERDVEDVVQTVMEAAWKSRRTWTPKGALSTWVFAITRNHVVVHLRRAHMRREVLVPDPLEGVGATYDPEALEELRREALGALAILERLPAHLAALFTRHEIEGDPMPEIAAELGIPLSTAWGQLGQARRAVAREVTRARAQRRE